MKIHERRLYQKNSSGYVFILCYVILNTIYSIFTLNAMNPDPGSGGFVMLSIFLLLLGFFVAIKVQIYSMLWSILAIPLGLLQFLRIFLTESNLKGSTLVIINLILILSGILCVGGGIVSVYNTRLRNRI